MHPWWLRPPAEGVAEDDEQSPIDEQGAGGAAPARGEADASSAQELQSTPETTGAPQAPVRTRRRPGRRRRGRDSASHEPLPVKTSNPEEEALPVESEDEAASILLSVLDRGQAAIEERRLALFCDLENIALGVRDSEIQKFDIMLVLERLLEKGKIIVKRAYADWERYSEFKPTFHEAGIELIDVPQSRSSGKNSADIKMAVDAMELCYSKKHLDTFVVLSGDSDFTPLVSKLKENNKQVIGVGVKDSSSRLLIDNCDEFIFYEDVWRDEQTSPKLDGLSRQTSEVMSLMTDAIKALMRENKDVLWGSMVKQTMQRKRPSFNEGSYGYSSFSELLKDAERRKLIKLRRDPRSGSYIVTGFAGQ